MKRVPEVADCWFDSGSMPFAQWGYPHAPGSKEQLAESYPADYISEAIDQTRGWFYTLLAVATLLKKVGAIKKIPPYEHVICLGHINDAKGQKMSKSKGNIVDPWDMFNKFGADAVRLHFYTVNQPGEPKNFDEREVDQVLKKTFMILLNVVSFYELYRGEAKPSGKVPKSKNVMDAWVLALLAKTVESVTVHLEAYEVTEAGRELADFVTNLSTWYVRRSRDRFKDELEKDAAVATLGYVLVTLAKLLAPFTPFLAEEVYQRIKGGLESVHLEEWPKAGTVDEKILQAMSKARAVVEQALAQRAAAGIKTRQPLRQLTAPVPEELKSLVADEVNVLNVVTGDSVVLDTKLDDELRAQGLVREFVRQVNALRKEQKLTINDRITLIVCAPAAVRTALERDLAVLTKAVLASKVEFVDSPQQHILDLEGVSVAITR